LVSLDVVANRVPQPYRPNRNSDALRGASKIVTAAVAAAFGIRIGELRAPKRRCASAAFARQAAMYLAHVAFGLSYTEVGRAFDRDRTTAAHACRLVEDRRTDPEIDARLASLEHLLRRTCGRAKEAA
jgi:chromosomal replication initiation ATPase DnaA